MTNREKKIIQMYDSLIRSVIAAGGHPALIKLDMTLESLLDILAQNDILFVHMESTSCGDGTSLHSVGEKMPVGCSLNIAGDSQLFVSNSEQGANTQTGQ